MLSLLKQRLSANICFPDDSNLKSFGLRVLVSYDCLEHFSGCNADMYWQLKVLVSDIRDCVHACKLREVMSLLDGRLGRQVLGAFDLGCFILTVVGRRLIIDICQQDELVDGFLDLQGCDARSRSVVVIVQTVQAPLCNDLQSAFVPCCLAAIIKDFAQRPAHLVDLLLNDLDRRLQHEERLFTVECPFEFKG